MVRAFADIMRSWGEVWRGDFEVPRLLGVKNVLLPAKELALVGSVESNQTTNFIQL